MNLKALAADMKRRAVALPGNEILPGTPLTHGARLKLKYVADRYEFRLQVQRSGPPPEPGTETFSRWLAELRTFARYFEAGEAFAPIQQKGETSYAAVITWQNEDAMNEDYAAWAGSVSQSVSTPSAKPALPVEIDEKDPIAKAFGRLPPTIQVSSTKEQR
jgi:hypothetical protein